MIGLADLIRSESMTEVDEWGVYEDRYKSPRVTWEREDLGVIVHICATRKRMGDWDVYVHINAFWEGGGSCIGESEIVRCKEAEVEAVAAAGLEAAMAQAEVTPFLNPVETLRWLAALADPPAVLD